MLLNKINKQKVKKKDSVIKNQKERLTQQEKKVQEKDRRLFKTYGIHYHEWLAMLGEQQGKCAICKTSGLKTNLCVDHIHIKGFKKMVPEEKKNYIRGLLCFMCNTALKGFEKTIDGKRNRLQLEMTYQYFKKYFLKGEI